VECVSVCSLQPWADAEQRAPRQLLATAMVCVWAVRLGSHLFTRVLRDGHDARFDGVRERPLVFINLWTIQVRRPDLVARLGDKTQE